MAKKIVFDDVTGYALLPPNLRRPRVVQLLDDALPDFAELLSDVRPQRGSLSYRSLADAYDVDDYPPRFLYATILSIKPSPNNEPPLVCARNGEPIGRVWGVPNFHLRAITELTGRQCGVRAWVRTLDGNYFEDIAVSIDDPEGTHAAITMLGAATGLRPRFPRDSSSSANISAPFFTAIERAAKVASPFPIVEPEPVLGFPHVDLSDAPDEVTSIRAGTVHKGAGGETVVQKLSGVPWRESHSLNAVVSAGGPSSDLLVALHQTTGLWFLMQMRGESGAQVFDGNVHYGSRLVRQGDRFGRSIFGYTPVEFGGSTWYPGIRKVYGITRKGHLFVSQECSFEVSGRAEAETSEARRRIDQAESRARRAASQYLKRVAKYGGESGGVDFFDPFEIYWRDDWRCGICGHSIDAAIPWPDGMAPSIDHIIPVVAGGGHRRDNAQAAHWACNMVKGGR